MPPPGDLSAAPSPTAQKAVFISHAKTNVGPAMEIVAALEASGVPCWIAPRDIPAGTKWGHAIAAGLLECRLLLLLCSQDAYTSQWVEAEVGQADKKRLPILPVRLDRCDPPDELDLVIHRYQWIDAFPPPMTQHLAAVTAAVKQRLGVASDEPSPDKSALPAQIGHFHILEALDNEGTGTIYLAEQREPVRRTVALKVIKPGFDTADVIARFESERQALVRMGHPNIARVLDAGTSEQGQPYFVTEYVPGRPIIEFADTHRLSIQARLELFLQVCDAIAHAHSKAIIHRDIKPSNVLALFREDRACVKVINFGIAKALTGERLTDQAVVPTRTHDSEQYAGTSPEQVRGSDDLDTRSDVYSLGALMYELLAGFKPFDAERLRQATEAEAARIICEEDPLRPGARLKSLPKEQAERIATQRQSTPGALARKLHGELECILLTALHKERQRRYASPLLLADDIRNYLHARPLDAAPKSQIYRFRKFTRRNWAAMLVVALIIGATAGFMVRITLAERRAMEQQRIAKRINEFLLNILSRADPKQGNKFTMGDAIADSIKLLKSRDVKEDLPIEVQASIWDTVGNVQRALGTYDEAETNLEKALAMRRQVLAADDPDIGRTLDHLAHLIKDKNDDRKDKAELARAEKLYDEAIAIFRKSLREDDLDLATTLNDRALLLEAQAIRLPEAESNCKEALKIRRSKPAPDSDILQSMGTLVDIYRKQGEANFPRADQQIQEAINLAAASLKESDPNVARLKLQQGKLLLAEGKLDEAETACREALMIDIKTLPRGHRYVEHARQAVNDVLKRKRGNVQQVSVEEVELKQAEWENRPGVH